MKKTFLIILICILECTFLSSCNIYKDVHEDKKDKPQKQNNAQYNKKYSAYIALDAFLTGKLDESLSYYFEKFGDTKEIKVDGNSDLYTGILLEFDKNEMEEELSYFSKQPSFGEVDNSVKELYPKLKELVSYLKEADLYYKLKSYVDDDFVRGKALHKKIYFKYREVKPLSKKFISNFESLFLKKSKKELESFKKNDFMVRYYSLSVILRAKDLETEIHNQGINSKNIGNLNITKFKEKYNLLVKDTNKFLEYSSDSDRLNKEKLDPTFAYANAFKSNIMNVKAAATDILVRAEQEKKNKDNDSYNNSEEGTPECYSRKIKDAFYEYSKIN